MWNEFINCTLDNEDWFQKHVGPKESEHSDTKIDPNSDGRSGNALS